MGLLRYLKELQAAIQHREVSLSRKRETPCAADETIRLVLGNTSADLDSICSALVFAYIFCRVLRVHTGANVWVIPVINIRKVDFRLRLAIVPFLETVFGTAAEDLADLFFFQDDPRLRRMAAKQGQPHGPNRLRLEVALVDHNLDQGMDSTGWRVEKESVRIVIDHHKAVADTDGKAEETQFPSHLRNWRGEPFSWVTGPQIGSTASLIGLLWKHACSACVPLQEHVELRKLLAAAIVRDTMNLDARLRGVRWTHLDEEALLWVNEGRASLSDPPVVQGGAPLDRAAFLRSYDAVQASISAHLSLTLPEILRMDAKTYTYHTDPPWTICMSSLSVSLSELLTTFCERLPSHAAFEEDLDTYTLKQKGNVLILMSLTRHQESVARSDVIADGSTSPRSRRHATLSRELAVFFPSASDTTLRKKQVCEALDAIPELELEPVPVRSALCWSERFRLFRQKNLHISRKVFEPRLRAILSRRC